MGRISLTPRFPALSQLAMAVALSTGMIGSMVAAPAAMAAPKAAKPGKAPKVEYSAGFRTAAVPAEKAMQEAQAAYSKVGAAPEAQKAALQQQAVALANVAAPLVAAAQAVATTGGDKVLAGNWLLNLGVIRKDSAQQEAGLRLMVDSGALPAADQGKFLYNLAAIEYDSKRYALARQHFEAARQAGLVNEDLDKLIADSLIEAGQVQQGLDALTKAIAARKAAGKPVPEKWLQRGLATTYTKKVPTAAPMWAEMLVAQYPTARNWTAALQVVKAMGGFDTQGSLDILRLMDRTNALTERGDLFEYIEVADARRLPGEITRVVNKGVTAGVLARGNATVSDALSTASAVMAADRASLPGLASKARSAGTGVSALGLADAYLGYGDAAAAAEFYALAIAKGGIDKERAQTRLGIALADKGDLAGARTAFTAVKGPRAAIAQMWLAYLKTKGA